MSGNITEINDILLTYEDGSLVKIVQGYKSVWTFTITDANDDPIDLSSWTISAEAEFHLAMVTDEGFSSPSTAKGTTPKEITVTIDPDQTTNTGVYRMHIPSDLYQGDIQLASERVPVAIIYETFEFESERRVERSAVSIRRGRSG